MALAAGKSVMQEKPVAATAEAAAGLLREYRSGGPLASGMWMLAENYRCGACAHACVRKHCTRAHAAGLAACVVGGGGRRRQAGRLGLSRSGAAGGRAVAQDSACHAPGAWAAAPAPPPACWC